MAMISLGMALAYLSTLGRRSPAEKILIMHLIYTLDDEPAGRVEGSAQMMAKAMGFSARSFQRHVAKLKTRGILEVHNAKSTNGMIAANQYALPGWGEFVKQYKEDTQKVAA
jgi:hypothetical protein